MAKHDPTQHDIAALFIKQVLQRAVERLQRDARINVVLGLLLPFISPLVFASSSDHLLLSGITTPQTMVWVMATWAFLPASLFMRGIAMARIAEMITDQRRKTPGPEHSVPAH